MDTHEKLPLTPKGREMMVRAVVDQGLSKATAARQFNTTPKTVGKWIERFEAEGVDGLRGRSSRPHSSPSQATPAHVREGRGFAPAAPYRQAHRYEVGVSAATVSRILKRLGLNACRRWSQLSRCAVMSGPPQARSSTSTSKSWVSSIGSVIGLPATGPARANTGSWLGVSASGDRRPLAPRLLRNTADEKRASCLRFLFNALRFFRSLDVKVERV